MNETSETVADAQTRAEIDGSPTPPVSNWGWYLYGIARGIMPHSESTCEIGFAGIPGLDGGEPVQMLMCGELAAVVSRVPLTEIGADAIRERLKDATWMERMVRGHGRVVETVHRERALLPAKFGCVYSSQEGLGEALGRARGAILQQLYRVEGCDEWGIRLYADRESIQRRVARENTAVSQMRQELQMARPGRAYFLKSKLAELLDAETDQALSDLAQGCCDRLTHLAVASELGSCDEARRANAETEILHAAFLVPRADTAVFLEEVGRFVDGEEGLRCEYTGPWPPYSFAAPIEADGADRSGHVVDGSGARRVPR